MKISQESRKSFVVIRRLGEQLLKITALDENLSLKCVQVNENL